MPLDQLGVAPIDEMLLDADAIGMAADETFAGVTLEFGEIEIVVILLLDLLFGFRRGGSVDQPFFGEE